MQTILTIGLIVISILLILVVLVQNSKGGGISSNFSAANQIMGARRGTDFIEKATWTLAILLLVFSLLSSPKRSDVVTDSSDTEGSITKQKASGAVLPAQQAPAQSAPSATPAQ